MGTINITGDLGVEKVQSEEERVSQVAEVLENAHVRERGAASDSEKSEGLEPPPRLLHQRIVVESQPVVFIGESITRSLPIALAVLRGSLEGIWATSREPLEKKWTSFEFDKMLEQQISRAKMNWDLKYPKMPPTDLHKAAQMSKFRAFRRYLARDRTRVTELLERFIEGADATNLRGSFDAPNSAKPTCNIWFQCPWRDEFDTVQPSTLLKSFVISAAEIQVPGDILIIGLTTHQKYMWRYDLDGLVEYATLCGYEHLVENNHLIDKLLDLGYRHVGRDEIHNHIFHTFVTHVFVKT